MSIQTIGFSNESIADCTAPNGSKVDNFYTPLTSKSQLAIYNQLVASYAGRMTN